ncbi:MAG: hypothetical protein HGA80_03285 [Candidatus Omnitrophica bacterium]|nr:hypothetical protein [Candidatus Omnitrophota bacterium]
MARNSIRVKTVTFLAAQSVILSVIMLAFVGLTSVLFVKNAMRWQLNKIEQAVLMFAQQAMHTGEIPRRGDIGEYSFFMLNRDGKYILPRLPRADEGEKLWEEYELKLVYEMQKRRDGWIYYPERDQAWTKDGRYVIRYVYLDAKGWIVAAEGYIPGEWDMLKGFLTPKLFLGLFLVVCLAFALMLLNAFWHFRKMVKAILRSQENNFIAAPVPPKTSGDNVLVKPEEKALSGGMIRHAPGQELPKARPERPVAAEPEQTSAAPGAAEVIAAPAPRVPPGAGARQMGNLEAVTIDTSGIRSPLLRKVIQEMRETKK